MYTLCEEIVRGEQCGHPLEVGVEIAVTYIGHRHLDPQEYAEEVAGVAAEMASKGVPFEDLPEMVYELTDPDLYAETVDAYIQIRT